MSSRGTISFDLSTTSTLHRVNNAIYILTVLYAIALEGISDIVSMKSLSMIIISSISDQSCSLKSLGTIPVYSPPPRHVILSDPRIGRLIIREANLSFKPSKLPLSIEIHRPAHCITPVSQAMLSHIDETDTIDRLPMPKESQVAYPHTHQWAQLPVDPILS